MLMGNDVKRTNESDLAPPSIYGSTMTSDVMAEVEKILKRHVLARLVEHFKLPHSVSLEPFSDDSDDRCPLLYVLRLKEADFGGWVQNETVILQPIQLTQFELDDDAEYTILLVTCLDPTLELRYEEVLLKSLGWSCLKFTGGC
jgi:hypothetical protein